MMLWLSWFSRFERHGRAPHTFMCEIPPNTLRQPFLLFTPPCCRPAHVMPECPHLSIGLADDPATRQPPPRGADDRWWSPPFDWTVVYEHPDWWSRQLGDDPWFVQVRECGVEVARAEVDYPGEINPLYEGVPELGDARLEIQFIEVVTAAGGSASALRWCAPSKNNTRPVDCSRTAWMPTGSGLASAGNRCTIQRPDRLVARCSSSRRGRHRC